MGRLEEMLAKMQARRLETRSGPHGSATEVLPSFETAGSGAVEAVPHEYGGKRRVLNIARLQAQRMLGEGADERRLADEYRVIKRPLLKNCEPMRDPPLRRANLWMVTSALAGEGKTFTSLNLWLSVARERDWSIVIVDADSRNPRMTDLLGAAGAPGFMDVLRDKTRTFDSLVMPTDVPGLSLMPAGATDEQASELFASERMQAVCEELAADPRRIVLFDAPPLLQVAEAPVLTTQVGQVVLVVRANKTPQLTVLAARDRIDPSVATCLLLNQADTREGAMAYGDYYPYGSSK
jgi:exopolysaccharide/PEP-CTERM locus tyrosine autokinase